MRFLVLLASVFALVLSACGPGSTTPGDGTDDPLADLTDPEKPIRVLVRPEVRLSMEAVLVDLAEPDAKVIRQVEGTPFWVVEIPPGSDVDAYLAELNEDERVLVAELDRRVSAPEGGGATLPVGGEFFDSTDVPGQVALSMIGVEAAHARATGRGIRVAVIDTGVDASHELLLGKIDEGGWDFVDGDPDPSEAMNGEDDDGDGFVDEGFGHGTFVSSLILAVAPDARIVPFRVLDTDCMGLTSSVADAIVMATQAGVNAINLSLGMEHHVHVIGEAIKFARQNGVVVIASAGNTGGEEVTFPATLSFALSLTAVDPADVLAPFASYGEDVDLSAPGVELLGAYPLAPNVAAKGSGTSFSAALAAGACALVLELRPWTSPAELASHIANAAWDNTSQNPEHEGLIGSGRLDVDAATR